MQEPGVPKQTRKRLSLSIADIQTGAAAELVVLIRDITQDGRISLAEAEGLRDWLKDGRLSDFPGIAYLRTTLNRALEDGVLSDEEREEIFSVGLKVLPPDIRTSVTARKKASVAAEREEARKEKQVAKEMERTEKLRDAPVHWMDFMVAGCIYEGRVLTIDAHTSPGTPVTLLREPNNRHDSNAVKVLVDGFRDIGYIPREEACEVAALLDRGHKYKASIKKILDSGRYPIPVVYGEIFGLDAQVVGVSTASVDHDAQGGDESPKRNVPSRAASSASGCGCSSCLTAVSAVVLGVFALALVFSK